MRQLNCTQPEEVEMTAPAPLTPSARHTLLAAAYLRGEPHEPFSVAELTDFENEGGGLFAPVAEKRSERGVGSKSLPALARRGFARARGGAGQRQWELTDAGFNEALRITGGYGLL
jgi:hypothetical protein